MTPPPPHLSQKTICTARQGVMAESQSPCQLPCGYVLGQYEIVQTLGQGSFGITYLAVNRESSHRVVIKENFPQDYSFRDEDSRMILPFPGKESDFQYSSDKFFKEAQTLAHLDHPGIVKVLECFKANGTYYFVMPYVEGVTLRAYWQEHGALEEEELTRILVRILEALRYLHQKGRLHRDIKPANILLINALQPVLIDFGTVRELDSDRTYTRIGTKNYAPIEQLQIRGRIGPWTDLYALGATMYEMVVGKAPVCSLDRVTDDGRDPLEWCSQLSVCRVRYSQSFLAGIDRALKFDQRQRWQNAQEWLDALQAPKETTGTARSDSSNEVLPEGYMLREYRIVKTIGQGGFGITYLAEDTDLHRQVVIKENFPSDLVQRNSDSYVHTKPTSKNPEVSYQWYVENFQREAQALARLKHPSIVRVLQFFTANGTAYYVMPYIEGIPLSQFRKEYGPPDEKWVRGMLGCMLRALEYIHANNLLHRDIKPDNILLTTDGELILIDFGSARSIISDKTQTIIASSGYAPIEQLKTHGRTGPWTDLYSLGATLYNLLTGEKPPRSIDRIDGEAYIPLANRPELQSKYSSRLLASIDKAFSIRVEDRWKSAKEWLNGLEGLIPASASSSSSSVFEIVGSPDFYAKEEEEGLRELTAQGNQQAQELLEKLRNRKWLFCFGVVILFAVGIFYVGWNFYETEVAEKYAKYAEQGDEAAQYHLGVCYEEGKGVEKDESKAAEWYAKSLQLGNVEALKRLKKLASRGNSVAQYHLGKCYKEGINGVKSEKLAIEWFTKSAAQGHAEAQFNLGVCYEDGTGVMKDDRKAVEWYEKSAEQGYAKAQFNLGVCYKSGRGVPKDEKKAAEWYEKSAEQGLAEAQCNLGLCYESGRGVPKDKKKAAEWYEKSAEQGYAKAQFNLGVCYDFGTGVMKDDRKAVEWLEKSAEQGYARAQRNLGLCYEDGTGVMKDDRKAVEWYTKSAEQGLAEAQFLLGWCYEFGRGVPKDVRKAVEWYEKSAAQGHAEAQKRLNNL